MYHETADFKSTFVREVIARGYLHQCTDLEALDERMARETITAYIGFDCTAPSLHAGSLVSIMLLRLLQRCGHRPIVLLGGGTTRIGDPSGKDESRKILSDEEIASNTAGIQKIFQTYLTFGNGPTDAVMMNNKDWLDGLGYIDFLRDYGRHFSVNRMMAFDSVRLRLEREQPLSFLEFNYMIFQAFDFVELARRHGCHLQMGGSDQWGNIVNGVDLGRRVDSLQLSGLTTPLLTASSGAKMGKTAEGAVWLNADQCSPYTYWQYWRNTGDADVGRFLRLFTELPEEQIADLEKLSGSALNESKKVLATEVTALCHGKDAALQAAVAAQKLFEQGAISEGLPTIDVPMSAFDGDGIAVFELMCRAGLAKSNSEARRLIRGGGTRINGERVESETLSLTVEALQVGDAVKLSAGKKRHVRVNIV